MKCRAVSGIRPPLANARTSGFERLSRSLAQLVEHRSPKPGVVGSSPPTPANPPCRFRMGLPIWGDRNNCVKSN
ncbi:hypothetical protein BREVUG8_10169 [Brevundimonas sp. G8]|nr:hypothetical protein BREVUG8_10169 [Brevundimonas sp. G8]